MVGRSNGAPPSQLIIEDEPESCEEILLQYMAELDNIKAGLGQQQTDAI